MTPDGDTSRTRLLLASAMKRLPAASTATPVGEYSSALVAGPPSPERPKAPLPATVLMTPAGDTSRTRLLPWSAMKRSPAASTANPTGLPARLSSAAVAGPPSPLKPRVPLPATVVIVPDGDTSRTQ